MGIRKIIGCMLLAGVIGGGTLTAAEDSNLTITTDNFGINAFKEVVWFDAYDVGGNIGTNTYVYSDAAGTNSAATDGEVDARMYNDGKTIQIRPSTLGSTSISVQVQGRAGTGTNWGELTTKTFTAATTTDYVISVVEHVEEIRVGVMSNGTAGTDSVTVTGSLIGRRK